MNEDGKLGDYFKSRQIDVEYYHQLDLPLYLKNQLPENKDSNILDIGCGLGQMLFKLKEYGYSSLTGIDISDEAINACKAQNLNVFQINDITDFNAKKDKFDFAIMSHVLEHLDKEKVISTLIHIRKNLLKETGKLLIMVPNAQALSGAYWAFEDFTHNTLFTTGSIFYVLKIAGFESINFIDSEGLVGVTGFKRLIKKLLLQLFKFNQKLMFIATGATYHKPSPPIYTWELKVLSSKN